MVPMWSSCPPLMWVRSVTSRPAITTGQSAANTMSAASGSFSTLASAAGDALPAQNALPPISTMPAERAGHSRFGAQRQRDVGERADGDQRDLTR